MSDRQVRIEAIGALCEEYTAAAGEIPDSWQLQRLANEILREELTDMHPDKMTRNEYPIMSRYQKERRNRRELPIKDVKSTYDNRRTGRKNISVESKNGGIYDKKQQLYDFSGSI